MSNKNRLHPTQKSVNHIKQYIELHTNKNDIVFDPFMGSGSTGVACINTNRKFIGIELDEKYFNIAYDRIKNRTRQLDLFRDWYKLNLKQNETEYKLLFMMNIIELKNLQSVGEVKPNSLIHGECIEAMRFLADKSIDMILADLPYG